MVENGGGLEGSAAAAGVESNGGPQRRRSRNPVALPLTPDPFRGRGLRHGTSSETRKAGQVEGRTTARLVALLPAGVLVMGSGAGGDPVGFLLHQPLGWACAAGGLALLLAGLGWIEVIAGRAEREGQVVGS